MTNEIPQIHGPVLVTGGTGTLGRHVVPRLQSAGRTVRTLSRHTPESPIGDEHSAKDLLKGEGIESAFAGIDTIVHLAGGPKGDDDVATNLVRAARVAGVRHIVYISVIAADSVPLGYFRSKFAAEQVIEKADTASTTLRAAQFHDLTLGAVRAMGRMPVVPAPGGVRWQPVDARDVAERLVELALAEPAGRVADLAGPAIMSLPDLTRTYLQARGKRRPFVPIRVPGKLGRVYRAGENLTQDGADVGKRTWEDFLTEQVGTRRKQ